VAGPENLNPLFEPFQLGRLSLRNRVVMAPMTRAFAKNGVHGPDATDYYRRRAEGGVALIISEGTPPSHPTAPFFRNLPNLEGNRALGAWREISDAVKATGAHMLIQLWHAGLLRIASDSDFPHIASIGPSGLYPHASVQDAVRKDLKLAERPTDGEALGGREMSIADIDAIIDAFASSAVAVQDLGFAGIELHAAHGYLIDQFFWSVTNQRTDKYGGGIADRTRFAVEIIQEIRRRTRPEFLISFRFSQFKPPHYDTRLFEVPSDLEAFLTPIVDAGVDVLHPSTRRFWLPEFPGSDLGLAGWTKKITGRPTIAVGSVGLSEAFDPRKGTKAESSTAGLERLMDMMARGDFDLIAIGRSLLANPDWVKIVKEKGEAALRPFQKEAVDVLF